MEMGVVTLIDINFRESVAIKRIFTQVIWPDVSVEGWIAHDPSIVTDILKGITMKDHRRLDEV